MFGIGWQELLVVLFILLLLFGAKKLPELSRSLGSAITEFRKGAAGDATKTSEEAGDSKSKK